MSEEVTAPDYVTRPVFIGHKRTGQKVMGCVETKVDDDGDNPFIIVEHTEIAHVGKLSIDKCIVHFDEGVMGSHFHISVPVLKCEQITGVENVHFVEACADESSVHDTAFFDHGFYHLSKLEEHNPTFREKKRCQFNLFANIDSINMNKQAKNPWIRLSLVTPDGSHIDFWGNSQFLKMMDKYNHRFEVDDTFTMLNVEAYINVSNITQLRMNDSSIWIEQIAENCQPSFIRFQESAKKTNAIVFNESMYN